MLINKRESTGIKHFNDFEAFIEYSNDLNDIYKNIEEYNRNKKQKILILLEGVLAYMFSKKKLNPKATELIIRGRTKHFSYFYSTISFCCI